MPAFEPTPLGLQQVPWNKILPSPLNPRKAFDAASLKELAISIHAEGLQQNLVVRPHPDRHGFYEVAAGERRYRAIGLLVTGFEREGHQWVEVPDTYPVNVLVQRLTDLELLQVATAENVQRRRMTPLEEADAFAAMIDRGATVPELHARFGLGQRTIARRVEISRHLIPDLRALYDAGKLTLGQVEILAQATPACRKTCCAAS
ncbi:ParB/RepB/Spo0J family partition protein [Deinococcus aquaticus]|uniref:ParB/RepB/Spo0J family partition protein n=1 Tax=Deinococcus aquaticus TaxID=328692 RepID=UPI0036183CD9